MSTVAVWQDSDTALVAELAALETRLHSTWTQMLSVVAEIDSRGTAATLGYPTTVELVRAIGRVPLGKARARIAAATDVLPSSGLHGAPVPPTLPATAVAVAEHAIGATARPVSNGIPASRIPASRNGCSGDGGHQYPFGSSESRRTIWGGTLTS
jgi:hypothetical protein